MIPLVVWVLMYAPPHTARFVPVSAYDTQASCERDLRPDETSLCEAVPVKRLPIDAAISTVLRPNCATSTCATSTILPGMLPMPKAKP